MLIEGGARASTVFFSSANAFASARAEQVFSVQRQLVEAITSSIEQSSARAIAAIDKRVAAVEARIATEAASIQISDVPGFIVKAPIAVILESEDQTVVARAPELDQWAEGQTETEAIEDLKTSIADLASDIWDEPTESLGRRPRHWQRVLRRLLEPAQFGA